MSQPLLATIDLDDVLARFSIFGRYYAVSAVFIIFAFTYNTIIGVNYIFVAEEVRYRCADINDTCGNSNGSFNVSCAQDTISFCKYPDTCTRWIYDNPDSFVAEFQLACQEWKRTLVGTVHSFGYMVGLLVVGPLSDKFGRKPLVVVAGITSGICGLAKSFVSIYWVYIVFEFIEAAYGEPYSPLFMLVLEMVSTKSRVNYTMICNIGFPMGGILFPFMYWLTSYWRTFLRVLYAPGLLFIFAFFLIDESPRWLLIKGNKKAAAKIINKAARIDKVDIKENLDMLTCKKDNNANYTTAIAETFKSRALLKSFSACTICWIVSVFVFYGLSINSVSLDGNKYVNYGLGASMKVPSYIITTYFMNKFNRKVPLLCCYMACAAVCISQPFIPNYLHWLSISMYMMGRLISTMFYSTMHIFTSELFPTYTRNSMHALCSSLGRIGGVAAPLTPLLMAYWRGLPAILFGVVSLVGALATFLLPDTGKESLPDTVLQAEALGDTRVNIHLEERQSSSSTKHNFTSL